MVFGRLRVELWHFDLFHLQKPSLQAPADLTGTVLPEAPQHRLGSIHPLVAR